MSNLALSIVDASLFTFLRRYAHSYINISLDWHALGSASKHCLIQTSVQSSRPAPRQKILSDHSSRFPFNKTTLSGTWNQLNVWPCYQKPEKNMAIVVGAELASASIVYFSKSLMTCAERAGRRKTGGSGDVSRFLSAPWWMPGVVVLITWLSARAWSVRASNTLPADT